VIHDWLPVFHVRERHEIDLAVTAERALHVILSSPAAPDRFVRMLFRLRGMDPGGSLHHFMLANGFTVLEHTPTSFVVGLIGPRRAVPLTAAEWLEAGQPRTVKIAAAVWAEDDGGHSRLVTETRIAAADWHGLIAFRLYWLFIGPFSKLIRRRWLLAAYRAATSTPGSSFRGRQGHL
jgi:hypothetical protein